MIGKPLPRRDWDLARCVDAEDPDKRFRVHDIDTENIQEGAFCDTLTCKRCGEQFKVSVRR